MRGRHLLFATGSSLLVNVLLRGLPGWLSGKEPACSAGDAGLIPGTGRSPGGGHGNPLQYSCLENPRDRAAWQATVHGVAESDTTEHARTHARVTMRGATLIKIQKYGSKASQLS